MAKIVLFADGTGNARTARFRTNVWKLYSALDSEPGSGQVAYYHDGVGTAAFAPLRVLGGIFGIGLGRNVRQLYAFICRNLSSDDDRIYLFGFSRGAFSVRILAGLIHHQGIHPIKDEAELNRWVSQAYRVNRLRLALAQVGWFRGALFRAGAAVLAAIHRDRQWPVPPLGPKVGLLGVWDTVAAYGGPIVEMVRGFDRWVWPLSMPDYTLSTSVLQARHALSLDEEREAFLPLPWDELGSEDRHRIKQRWFAGVHSDVGGGYADEGLSGVALEWMMDEAKEQGLVFAPAAEAALRASANPWGPMHDSRSGAAVVYRYQPRSIEALMGLTSNSPLRDPESGNNPLIDHAVVHRSVIDRIRDPDGYAPIVLPTVFDVDNGERIALPRAGRDIWWTVGARRWMQRLLLLTLLIALVSPLHPTSAVTDFIDEMLRGPLSTALALVPLMPAWLKEAYAGSGSWLVPLGVLAIIWVQNGDLLRQRIGKASGAMWANRSPAPPGAVAAVAPSDHWRDLRRAALRRLRWRILPGVFGLGFYALAAFAGVLVLSQLTLMAREPALCTGGGAAGPTFATSEPCHRLGRRLTQGSHYRVRLVVNEPWADKYTRASPTGFTFADSFSQNFHHGFYGHALRP